MSRTITYSARELEEWAVMVCVLCLLKGGSWWSSMVPAIIVRLAWWEKQTARSRAKLKLKGDSCLTKCESSMTPAKSDHGSLFDQVLLSAAFTGHDCRSTSVVSDGSHKLLVWPEYTILLFIKRIQPQDEHADIRSIEELKALNEPGCDWHRSCSSHFSSRARYSKQH